MYRSGRAEAAAAAEASSMQPINALSKRAAAPSARKSGARITKPPRRMAPPPPRDGEGRLAVLQKRGTIDADEIFGEQEQALSEFLRLHPMLSLESTSHRSLQLVADLVDKSSIPTKELEVVPKSHDDGYLRPPNTSLGERPCCLGERCICVWLARWRYGDDTNLAFVGAEFLLPSQSDAFLRDGTLPPTPGKCLVCSRYYHTFIYRSARLDPTFRPSASIPLQAYGNALGVVKGEDFPTHASVASDADGYRQEALLFVDEDWSNTAAARGGMSTFLWRPCVKFCANDYVYVTDAGTELPRMIQRGMGVVPDAEVGQDFRRPALLSMGTELALTSHHAAAAAAASAR